MIHAMVASVAIAATSPSTRKVRAASPVTISGQGVSLYDALQSYARYAHINIYIDPTTPNTAQNFHIAGITNAQALQSLIQANGLAMTQQNGILYIATPDIIASRYQGGVMTSATIPVSVQPSTLAPSLQAMLPLGTKVYPEDTQHAILVVGPAEGVAKAQAYLQPGGNDQPYAVYEPVSGHTATALTTMYAQLYPYADPNTLIVDEHTNRILIRGTSQFLTFAQRTLGRLDAAVPQVFYTVSIIEIEPEAYESNRGVLFGGMNSQGQQVASSGSTFTALVRRALPFNLTINALESQGKARVFARPSLLVANGETNSMQNTTAIPYTVQNQAFGPPTVQFVNTGVILSAKPTVSGTTVRSELQASYTAQDGIGTQGIPVTTTSVFTGTVDTNPDEVVVLNGLLADSDQDTVTGLPPFNHLFFLGSLFRDHAKNRRHVEVLMVMQPHVEYAGGHTLPVSFPSIPNDLIQHGIEPAPGPTATSHP